MDNVADKRDWKQYRELQDKIVKEVRDGDNFRDTLRVIKAARLEAWNHIPDEESEAGSNGEFWEWTYGEFSTLELVVDYAFERAIKFISRMEEEEE